MAAEILPWEFKCEDCRAQFKLSVPKGPAEEKEMKCPACSSKKIKRTDCCCLGAQAAGG